MMNDLSGVEMMETSSQQDPNQVPFDKNDLLTELSVHMKQMDAVKTVMRNYSEDMKKSILEEPELLKQTKVECKIGKKLKNLRNELAAYERALKPFKDIYDVEIYKEDDLVKIVLWFKDAKTYPMHFFVDYYTNDITDFIVSSICNKEQEKLLKQNYYRDKNMARVMNTLRAILIKKNIVK